MRRIGRFAARLALLLFTAGLALRLTVRDGIDVFAVIFYATPWPVLAVLPLAEAMLRAIRGQRLAMLGFQALSAACAFAWIQNSYVTNFVSSGKPRDLRLVFWNAEHPKHRLPEVIGRVTAYDAEVIAVAETEATKLADQQRWRVAFAGYALYNLSGGLLFLTKLPATREESGPLGRGGNYHVFRIKTQSKDLILMLVDFSAAPLRSRRPAFDALSEVIGRYSGEEFAVMGDFNTPRESVHFRFLRGRSQHAFETAGAGFAETWPVPLPVLTLDHVWVQRGMTIQHCELPWSWLSDHRAVVVDLSLQPHSLPGLLRRTENEESMQAATMPETILAQNTSGGS